MEKTMKRTLLLASASLILAAPAFAGTVIPLARFSSIHAIDGADVVVRYGATQQVVLVKGDPHISRIEVVDGRLELATCVLPQCPRHYEFKVEVTTPAIAAVSAEDGAVIDASGTFPAQGQLSVSANDGGNVDLRAIAAANVNAKANDGGNVRLHANGTLNASADDGGNIHYWGNPTLNRRVSDGGNVDPGE
jgi:hypothetical protein